MRDTLQPLLTAVQRNCHISDARHAGNYTLCIYLLKMREYFRWEKKLSFRDRLPEADVGDWLTDREQLWETMENEPFGDLPIDGKYYDPFDSDAVNALLRPYGLVYSGGLGNRGTPHFFLGKLSHQDSQSDFTVLVSGKEYARDLTAPPAMAQGDTIFVRRESLRRMIWEKIEEWQWNKQDNPMGRAVSSFDYASHGDAALDDITDIAIDAALLHEKGEVFAGKILGPEWEEMLSELSRSNVEIMIRAVRDHLADSLTTLPSLVQQGSDAALHLYMANLPNMHKHLAPALIEAYETWSRHGKREAFDALLPAGQKHWEKLALEILDTYRKNPNDQATHLQALVENRAF